MDDIVFIASVHKVQTLVDGGWRFTFNASENSAEIGALLAECQRFGVVLKLVANTIEEQGQDNGEQANPRLEKSGGIDYLP
jgi:hypothetical protein